MGVRSGSGIGSFLFYWSWSLIKRVCWFWFLKSALDKSTLTSKKEPSAKKVGLIFLKVWAESKKLHRCNLEKMCHDQEKDKTRRKRKSQKPTPQLKSAGDREKTTLTLKIVIFKNAIMILKSVPDLENHSILILKSVIIKKCTNIIKRLPWSWSFKTHNFNHLNQKA